MATFLLEIGTEELPADFARLALDQLEPMVARDLNEQRLNHTGLSCTSTPRRIALSSAIASSLSSSSHKALVSASMNPGCALRKG